MFRSIGLNVDSTHFVIAQGKIKSMTHLKPTELSSFLEETAGINSFILDII